MQISFGGPNGQLSLTQARQNFRSCGASERRYTQKCARQNQRRFEYGNNFSNNERSSDNETSYSGFMFRISGAPCESSHTALIINSMMRDLFA